jgi:hypothetical protein
MYQVLSIACALVSELLYHQFRLCFILQSLEICKQADRARSIFTLGQVEVSVE